jgi:hypothetical protein
LGGFGVAWKYSQDTTYAIARAATKQMGNYYVELGGITIMLYWVWFWEAGQMLLIFHFLRKRENSSVLCVVATLMKC